jgi:hypothetical protein
MEYVDENSRDGQEEVDRTGHLAAFVTLLKPVSLPPQGLRAAYGLSMGRPEHGSSWESAKSKPLLAYEA